MHSSRMRIVSCSSRLPGVGFPPSEVSAQAGCLPRGWGRCLLGGVCQEVSVKGVSAQGGVCTGGVCPGGCIPVLCPEGQHALGQTPPPPWAE